MFFNHFTMFKFTIFHRWIDNIVLKHLKRRVDSKKILHVYFIYKHIFWLLNLYCVIYFTNFNTHEMIFKQYILTQKIPADRHDNLHKIKSIYFLAPIYVSIMLSVIIIITTKLPTTYIGIVYYNGTNYKNIS